MREKHEVVEDENSDGIFWHPAAINVFRNGVILRMTCRWCGGAMDVVQGDDPDYQRDPATGTCYPETKALICPVCDAPAVRSQLA